MANFRFFLVPYLRIRAFFHYRLWRESTHTFSDSFVRWSVLRWDVEISLFCSGWWIVVHFTVFFWSSFFYYCEHILRMPLVTLVVWCDVLWVVRSEVKWSAVKCCQVGCGIFSVRLRMRNFFSDSFLPSYRVLPSSCITGEHNLRIPPVTLVVGISLFEVKCC